jgi:UDP:flavonoid glycosyltransferase YjiC (YdhE family)
MRKSSHHISIGSNSRLRLMKLEPRMLFDGAALAEALTVDSWADDARLTDGTVAQVDTIAPVGERSIAWELFSVKDKPLPVVSASADEATNAIRDYLANASNERLLKYSTAVPMWPAPSGWSDWPCCGKVWPMALSK